MVDDEVELSELEGSRSEFRIKRKISEIEEECRNLEETDEQLRCMSLTQQFDDEMTSNFQRTRKLGSFAHLRWEDL